MAFNSVLTLLGTMFVLAIVPSPSVFAVVARSMVFGFTHGVITTMGIVAGDFIFILLALLGLWSIAETTDSLFFLVKYLGSIYLIYLGITTWRTQLKQQSKQQANPKIIEEIKDFSWLSNFTCGLLITLSDPKAILFYAGFLPGYLDISSISITETVTILLSATVAVGGAKLIYAYLADRARFLFNNARIQMGITILAGSVLIGTGIVLALKG